ncbi:MAG: hypothetical protein AB7N24_16945 [Dehalococcoidia bacterium]
MKLSPSSAMFFSYLSGVVVIALIIAIVVEAWWVALGLAVVLAIVGLVFLYRWMRSGEIEHFRDRGSGRSY